MIHVVKPSLFPVACFCDSPGTSKDHLALLSLLNAENTPLPHP